VLFLKRAVDPRAAWVSSCQFSSTLSLHLTSRPPSWCDRDEDGFASTDCNDANPAIHPAAPDTACNGVDDDCDGVADDGTARVLDTPLLHLSRQTGTVARLEWSSLAAAANYDCVRGTLPALQASGGDFTTSTSGCVADALTTTSTNHPAPPVVGSGFWYLVRGVNACGYGGPYDGTSPRQVGLRDPEIALVPTACP
jgi:hypothetical protein